jgi:hypothetical protein
MEKITKKVTYSYSVYYHLSSSNPRVYSIHSKNFSDKSIREEVLFNSLEILYQLDAEVLQIRRIEYIRYVSIDK